MPPMNFAKELAQMKAENGGLYEHLSGLSKAELMDRASALEIEGRSKAKNKDDLVKLIFDFESVAFRKHDVAKYFAETFTSEGLRKILVAYGIKGAPTTLDERAWYIGLYAKTIRVEQNPFKGSKGVKSYRD